MNTILKNTISITVITLVAGLALGVVQDITAGPIAAQAEKSKEEAYKTVFEDASGFSEYSLDDKGQAEDLVGYLNDNGFSAQTIDEIMVAEDASGETLGYAFTITDSEGYGGDRTDGSRRHIYRADRADADYHASPASDQPL